MKQRNLLTGVILLMVYVGIQAGAAAPENCTPGIIPNPDFPKAAAVQAVFDRILDSTAKKSVCFRAYFRNLLIG